MRVDGIKPTDFLSSVQVYNNKGQEIAQAVGLGVGDCEEDVCLVHGEDDGPWAMAGDRDRRWRSEIRDRERRKRNLEERESEREKKGERRT